MAIPLGSTRLGEDPVYILGKATGVAEAHIHGFPAVLCVQFESLRKRLSVEELGEFSALEGYFGDCAAELLLDRLLHSTQLDALRVAYQHPEKNFAQLFHILDLIVGRSAAILR